MKKIYIAGKINGLKNYREIFQAAEDKLTAEGNAVMNPAVLGEGFNYEVYLPICLLMLQACDTVYMLNNWKDSKGAKVELEYAKAQGKEIIYQAECSFVSGDICIWDEEEFLFVKNVNGEEAQIQLRPGVVITVPMEEIKHLESGVKQ